MADTLCYNCHNFRPLADTETYGLCHESKASPIIEDGIEGGIADYQYLDRCGFVQVRAWFRCSSFRARKENKGGNQPLWNGLSH